MKKRSNKLIGAICIVLLMAATIGISVNAKGLKATQKSPAVVSTKAGLSAKVVAPSKSSFGVYYFSMITRQLQFGYTCPNGAESIHFQVFKNGKLMDQGYYNDLTAGEGFHSAKYYSISYNAVYSYRIQGIDAYGKAGAWSAFRYISIPSIKASVKSNKKGFKIKTPKNKRIKKYVVMVSKSKNGKFKKVKTIKAKKKKTTSIKKKYKKRGYTYFYVYSYIKVGKKSIRSDVPSSYYILTFK